MSPSRKDKSVESLEDAFLKAMDLDDRKAAEQNKPPAAETSLPGPPHAFAPDEAAPGAVTGPASLQLHLADDYMRASLALTGREQLSVEAIRQALHKAGVIYGLDPVEIEAAARYSLQPGKFREFILARGTPPEASRVVRYAYLPEDKGGVRDVSAGPVVGLPPDSARLKDLFAAPEASALQTASVMVKAVNAGEIFIQVKEFPQARPGKDVFGFTLECPVDLLPDAGDHVSYNEKAGGFEALVYGYVCVDRNTISVQPPLWVTAGKQSAYYVCLPQLAPCRYPPRPEVREMLQRTGIAERCINDPAIDKLVAQMAAGMTIARLVKLAETVQPEPGRNASFTLFIDTAKKAGTLRSDGTLDLRERTAVVSVPEGTLIAEKLLATKGTDGCTLFGKPLRATSGTDKKIVVGKGVRPQQTENSIQYYAGLTGNIKFSQNTLCVEDIFSIRGDIDYSTGNIDIKTDLLISGSVLRGFSVKSRGDIAIMGTVEDGATVMAGGNLSVDKGIIGADSKVVVMGDLCTNYIQDAEVLVKGNVTVKSYLFNCSLIASGSITVLKEQGQKSGRAVGGIVCSSKEIRLSTIGSAANTATVMAVRPDPELIAKLKKLEEQALFCTQNIAKISRSLPFDSFNPAQIKAILAKIPAAKREGLILLLANLNKLIKNKKDLTAAVEGLKSVIDTALQHASIEAFQQVFKGSQIHIGKQTLVINEDLSASVFQLRDEQIVRN